MKRVVVIGSGGAGKTTFANKLGKATGRPVIHLDKLFWRPGWTRTPDDEWNEIVRREIAREEWIMDGNFGGTRAMRMDAADTVVFLDLPRWLCMYRILKRTLVYRKRVRPDMADGCHERFDMKFILWVWNYRRVSRVRAFAEFERLENKRLVILTTRREVDAFLMNHYAN